MEPSLQPRPARNIAQHALHTLRAARSYKLSATRIVGRDEGLWRRYFWGVVGGGFEVEQGELLWQRGVVSFFFPFHFSSFLHTCSEGDGVREFRWWRIPIGNMSLMPFVFRFLWRYLDGKLSVFKWTGKNDYVALCEPGYLSFGGGYVPPHIHFRSYITFYIQNRDGRYGLYLDDTLLDGSSARCPTFDNEPLCSSSGAKKGGNVTFECVGLEVWAVGPS